MCRMFCRSVASVCCDAAALVRSGYGAHAIATSCREVDVATASRRRMLWRRKAEAAMPYRVCGHSGCTNSVENLGAVVVSYSQNQEEYYVH